jgi:hypothetical protein
MRELIGGLADDFVVNPYNKKRKAAKAAAASGGAGRSTRRVVQEPTAEEPFDGEEAEAPAPARSTRSRRFAALETELKADEPDADAA